MTQLSEELIPTRNNIIFQFVDEVKNGNFVDQRSSGVIVDLGNSHDRSGKFCRVGVVHSVGENVDGVNPGDKILINPLMWTESFDFKDQKFWMTIPEHVAAKVN